MGARAWWVLAACVVAAGGAGCDDGDEGPSTVTMSGTAYTFNTPNPVAGAVVRVVEVPGLETTTAADGGWSLEVPANREITPYVTHEGHVTMHLQTFEVGEAPLERVYFQMVADDIFELLAQVLQITPDPERCQIAGTVSEKAIQTMSFDEFKAHGAHGVAGATVTITPAAAEVVYFNEMVIPDRTRTETSRDGGVVWTNVPPGRYTIKATHPEKQFAEIVVSCEAGRFVNANPPQGLREL